MTLVKTSYYGNLRQVRAEGLVPVRITVGYPRGVRGKMLSEKRLAPTYDMLKLPYEEYAERFELILRKADPEALWDELHARCYGEEPALLCYEKPPLIADNWCHRRMVSRWFELHLGVQVPEMPPSFLTPPAKRMPRLPMFDLFR